MGGCVSSDENETSSDLRKRKNIDRDEFDGPVKSRGCTDVPYLILFVLFIGLWIGLVCYCVAHGDLRRIYKGYDDCGNICGISNEKLTDEKSPFYTCSGKNYSNAPLMLIYERDQWKTQKRTCVSKCDSKGNINYKEYFQRCLPEDQTLLYSVLSTSSIQEFFEKAAEDISACWKELVYLCLFALFLSVFMILLFRYFAGILVWFVLICVVVVSVGVTGYLWKLWQDEKNMEGSQHEDKASTYFIYSCLATFGTVIILLLIFGMRKSIHLVAHLFRESGKAVQAMPLIMLQPFVTFIAVVVLLSLWVYAFLWIESSGFAKVKVDSQPIGSQPGRLTFKKDEVIQLARCINCLAIFWMVQFIIGCQHMIIAGSVSTWFFTRKKTALSSPIAKSYGFLFTFHLGTVAFGSMLIAIVQIVRVIFKAIKSLVDDPKNDVTRSLYKAFSCCLYCLEKILVYLTRNAYIEVAIFGDGLWTSGKRAYHVLVSNSLRVFAINSVGDFVLFLGKALVVACSIFIGFNMLKGNVTLNYISVPLGLIGVFAYLVSHAFMTAFEMIIDTIFICFCEDCEMNDGDDHPYYMSKGLMEFVEKSQKVLRVGDSTAQPRSQTCRWLPEED